MISEKLTMSSEKLEALGLETLSMLDFFWSENWYSYLIQFIQNPIFIIMYFLLNMGFWGFGVLNKLN